MGTIMLSESASRNIRTEAQAIETAEMLLCNLDVTSALLPPYLSPDLDLKTWGRGTPCADSDTTPLTGLASNDRQVLSLQVLQPRAPPPLLPNTLNRRFGL